MNKPPSACEGCQSFVEEERSGSDGQSQKRDWNPPAQHGVRCLHRANGAGRDEPI